MQTNTFYKEHRYDDYKNSEREYDYFSTIISAVAVVGLLLLIYCTYLLVSHSRTNQKDKKKTLYERYTTIGFTFFFLIVICILLAKVLKDQSLWTDALSRPQGTDDITQATPQELLMDAPNAKKVAESLSHTGRMDVSKKGKGVVEQHEPGEALDHQLQITVTSETGGIKEVKTVELVAAGLNPPGIKDGKYTASTPWEDGRYDAKPNKGLNPYGSDSNSHVEDKPPAQLDQYIKKVYGADVNPAEINNFNQIAFLLLFHNGQCYPNQVLNPGQIPLSEKRLDFNFKSVTELAAKAQTKKDLTEFSSIGDSKDLDVINKLPSRSNLPKSISLYDKPYTGSNSGYAVFQVLQQRLGFAFIPDSKKISDSLVNWDDAVLNFNNPNRSIALVNDHTCKTFFKPLNEIAKGDLKFLHWYKQYLQRLNELIQDKHTSRGYAQALSNELQALNIRLPPLLVTEVENYCINIERYTHFLISMNDLRDEIQNYLTSHDSDDINNATRAILAAVLRIKTKIE